MKILPSFIRQSVIAAIRNTLAPKILRTPCKFPHHGRPVSLHMVVGKSMCLLGMTGLRSLEIQTGVTWGAFIHDDGTLDDRDVENWKSHFPDCTVIRKAEADEAAGRSLGAYPCCRENRLKHHWFLKVFDTRLHAPHEHFIVLDSDILFFRRPDLVMDWIRDCPDSFFVMKDTREKYSGPRSEIEEKLGRPLMERVNSGLDLVPKKFFPLEPMEEFLRKYAPVATHYEFLEQTIFAVCASSSGTGRHLPPEYEISWNNFRNRESVCRHYVGPFKFDAFFVDGIAGLFLEQLLRR